MVMVMVMEAEREDKIKSVLFQVLALPQLMWLQTEALLFFVATSKKRNCASVPGVVFLP